MILVFLFFEGGISHVTRLMTALADPYNNPPDPVFGKLTSGQLSHRHLPSAHTLLQIAAM
jgi:hypothetical protein